MAPLTSAERRGLIVLLALLAVTVIVVGLGRGADPEAAASSSTVVAAETIATVAPDSTSRHRDRNGRRGRMSAKSKQKKRVGSKPTLRRERSYRDEAI